MFVSSSASVVAAAVTATITGTFSASYSVIISTSWVTGWSLTARTATSFTVVFATPAPAGGGTVTYIASDADTITAGASPGTGYGSSELNLEQLARKARFEVDGIRTGNVASALYSDEEVYSAVNAAQNRALRIMRLAGSAIPQKVLASTDPSTDLLSETYAPTSLRLVSGTINYTLPPDLVSIISIAPLTTGYDGLRFRPLKTSQKTYIDQRSIPAEDLSSLNNDEGSLFYVRLGKRTLRIVPTVQDTIDIELIYTYMPPRLKVYSTGTVTIDAGTPTIVTGASTAWIAAGLRTPAQFISGSASVAVSLSTEYPTISTIDSDTQMTMAKSQGALAGSAYRVAMVPVVPGEHHEWLAMMAGALLFRKVNIETSDAAIKELEKQLINEIQPEVGMDQMQESLIVEPFELP